MRNTSLFIVVAIAVVLVGAGCNNSAPRDTANKKQSDAVMEDSKTKKTVMEKADSNATNDESKKMAQENPPALKDEKIDAMKKDTDAAMIKTETSAMEKNKQPSESMMAVGGYANYSIEKLSFAKTGRVVLFFKASWCPTCKAVDADITARSTDIPKDVLILKVDYDTAGELKKKYGVTYQHTFVQVNAEGVALAKWSGSQTLAALLAEIK